MSTYVLVHGAWHSGDLLEATAAPIRAAGHEVHCPTLAGNRPGDAKTVGLADAIGSIVDYLEENDLNDVLLMGHSYGGMVITGVADKAAGRIRWLIYWNAFVPNDGESLNDMVPPHYVRCRNGAGCQPATFRLVADVGDSGAVALARVACSRGLAVRRAPIPRRERTTAWKSISVWTYRWQARQSAFSARRERS
jgi:pimeloyl-ACP methyl ester carboxylesterase